MDGIDAMLVLFYFMVFGVIAIAFLKWVYRASRNSHGFHAVGLKHSPRWAVTSYFIPVLWFWVPFQAMKEVWQVSRDPENWRAQRAPACLYWWWTLWIAGGVAAGASLALSEEEVWTTWAASLVMDLLDIALGLTSINLLTRIVQNQVALVEQRQAPPGEESEPTPPLLPA